MKKFGGQSQDCSSIVESIEMNRTTLFGIALFCAVLGIAVMGSDNQATAGHRGCAGARQGGLFRHHRACQGVVAAPRCETAPVTCAGDTGCAGRRHGGLLARLRARHSCAGAAANNCCGQAAAPACAPACPAPAPACEPTCGAPADCGCGAPAEAPCAGCGAGVVESAGTVIESAPVEAAPVEVPAATEVAPEVPPAPADAAAQGSA